MNKKETTGNYAHKIDPNAPKIEIESITTTPRRFDNPFQALDWLYRNPMKEIEYYENDVFEIFRYNKNEYVWEYPAEYENGKGSDWQPYNPSMAEICNWKNIKQHIQEPKESK